MFYKELLAEYERLLRENRELKEQNRFLTEDNSRFQIQIANMIKKGYNND